jgi:uncharacterized membrane protein YfcA
VVEYFLGFVIALAVGLTGFGGGVLAVPLLIAGLNVPVVEAVGTSLVFVTVIKLMAVNVYRRRGQVNWSVAARLLLGGAPGVIGGSLLLWRMNTAALQPAVLAVVGATIAAMALLGLWKCWRNRTFAAAGAPREHLLPWLAFPIGVEVGFSSAGAGALGSLVLMECTTILPAHVIGTDLVFGVGLSALGGGLHLAAGEYNPALLLRLCSGGLLGAWAGARLAGWLPPRPLRACLCLALVGLGGHLGWRGLALLAR